MYQLVNSQLFCGGFSLSGRQSAVLGLERSRFARAVRVSVMELVGDLEICCGWVLHARRDMDAMLKSACKCTSCHLYICEVNKLQINVRSYTSS